MHPTIYTVTHSHPQPGVGLVSTMAHPAGGALLEGKARGLCRLGVDVLVSAQTDSERVECDLVGRGAGSGPLFELYRRGAHVVFHCWAGIGRSSLLAGLLLGMDGVEPSVAWRVISAARGLSVPDNREQEE